MGEAQSAWWTSPGAGLALRAGLVCGCCYLGSELGGALASPQLGAAILFPPYAVLTAALLLSPVRHWWIYLLASSVGNYFAHQRGWPTSWALLSEGANSLRAVVAAGGVRYFSACTLRFDTFRGGATFLLFAVILAPVTAAFVGAGVVILHHPTQDFWLVWQAWFLSNALTGLTLLPIIIIGITNAGAWMRNAPFKHLPEAGLIAVGLLVVGTLVFVGPYAGPSSLPASLYAPLPFLLWAAVRFGPGGVSVSVLAITALTIWGVLSERGPFVTPSRGENLLSLQLFQLSVSLPLMVLAFLMEERQRTAQSLQASYEKIQNLAGRLITAQESERIRIARDLHDDISQRIAALSIALSSLKRQLPEGLGDAQGKVARLQQQTIALSEEIRRLSHELHPGVLQHAGLTATLRGSCEEFGRQHEIEVMFHAEGMLDGLSREAALCLYRVAQEALHNIAAHAQARHARVDLIQNGDGVELTVEDNGQGFDQTKTRRGTGLGLISIDERVRLVRGQLSINSISQRGTRIQVKVPLDEKPQLLGQADQHAGSSLSA